MKRLLVALLLLLAAPALAQKPSINGVAGPTTSAQLQSIITDSTGTGALNFGPPQLLPITTLSGASKTYAGTDLYIMWRRSNGASVMTDTLPASTAPQLINGARLNIANVAAAPTFTTSTIPKITITAGAGTTIDGAASYVIQPGQDVDLVYDLANTAWRANVNSFQTQLKIPALPGEVGVVNDNWPPGHAFRYGISCDQTVNYATQVEDWMASTGLVGVTATLPACPINMSMNTKPTLSFSSWYGAPGSALIGIMHLISADGADIPTATCTTSGGAVNSITVTAQGSKYFGPAPAIRITSAGGGNTLTGASITSLLELQAIDRVMAAGTGYVVGEDVTFEHGIVLRVATASSGVPTSWTITNRGTPSADSRPRGIGGGNQYTQVSTTGSGSGARMLLFFRIPSTLTIASGGSGGAASCSVNFEPPSFRDANFGGDWASYVRLGVQNAKNITIHNYEGLSDTSVASGGLRYSGDHIDSVVGLTIDNYTCNDAQQRSGFSGYACLAIESQAGDQTDRVNIKHALIKKADLNAVSVCEARVHIVELTILSYGRANAVTGDPYCDALSVGYGIYQRRSAFTVGKLTINNNEQLLGSLASDSVHIVSTGYGTNPLLYVDNKAALQQASQWGTSFGDVLLTNVLRGGGLVIDNSTETAAVTCDVAFSSMRVQYAGSTAMTAGRAGVMVSSPAATPSLANKRCTLTGNFLQYLNSGSNGNATLSPQPDGLIVSANATATINLVRFPNGGVGTAGLVQALGQFNGTISWDQQTNVGLPASAGSNPVFLFQGTGTAGSNVRVYANDYDNHLSMTSPLVRFDGTSQMNASVWMDGLRNGTQLSTVNTNTDPGGQE